MTGYEFRELYNENAQKELAAKIAETIVIRDYVNGSSRDTRRESTPKEKQVIANIANAALTAYGYRNGDIDGILDMAEFSLMNFLGFNVNTYDTIYIPLRKLTKTGLWDK